MARYAIPDEPLPSRYTQLVVTPYATMLGVMLGGSLVGLPWMAVNGWAMGSATWKKEVASFDARIAPFLERTLLRVGLGVVSREAAPYLAIFIQAFRLAGGYWVYMLQSASFELYQHFGGRVSRGGWAGIRVPM